MIQLATAERHEGRTAADLGSVDGCRLAPDLLAEIASGLAISESPWQPDGTADYTRRYRQLLSTDQYDAWPLYGQRDVVALGINLSIRTSSCGM